MVSVCNNLPPRHIITPIETEKRRSFSLMSASLISACGLRNVEKRHCSDYCRYSISSEL